MLVLSTCSSAAVRIRNRSKQKITVYATKSKGDDAEPELIGFHSRDSFFYPTLQVLHKFPDMMPRMQVRPMSSYIDSINVKL